MNGLLFPRYVAASAAALAVDLSLFTVALAAGGAAPLAAAFGYTAGIAAHWLLSSRAVFVGRIAPAGEPRRQQQLLFVGSALVGLALTIGIVALGDALAVDPRLAKLGAVGTAFQATFLLRRRIVFA